MKKISFNKNFIKKINHIKKKKWKEKELKILLNLWISKFVKKIKRMI